MAQHLTNIASVHYVDRLEQHDIERFCSQQNQVSAYFTSVQMLLLTRRRQWHQRKGSIYLIYKLANTTFWQRYGRKSQLRNSKCPVYQGADNTFWLCTGRTDVKRKSTTDVCLESQTKNLGDSVSKLKIGPKLNFSRTAYRNWCSSESNALWKSRLKFRECWNLSCSQKYH